MSNNNNIFDNIFSFGLGFISAKLLEDNKLFDDDIIKYCKKDYEKHKCDIINNIDEKKYDYMKKMKKQTNDYKNKCYKNNINNYYNKDNSRDNSKDNDYKNKCYKNNINNYYNKDNSKDNDYKNKCCKNNINNYYNKDNDYKNKSEMPCNKVQQQKQGMPDELEVYFNQLHDLEYKIRNYYANNK